MPSLQMPLRQYPSTNGLRHTDPLRQHALPEEASSNSAYGPSMSAVEKALPPIGAQSLHDYRFATARKSHSTNGHANPHGKADGFSPPSDPQRDVKQLSKSMR